MRITVIFSALLLLATACGGKKKELESLRKQYRSEVAHSDKLAEQNQELEKENQDLEEKVEKLEVSRKRLHEEVSSGEIIIEESALDAVERCLNEFGDKWRNSMSVKVLPDGKAQCVLEAR